MLPFHLPGLHEPHRGILKGGDMTTEALVAKTMWARGQASDADEVRALFGRVVNHDRTTA